MTYFFILRPSERSEESHRKSAEVYALSLKSWDISLTLNMTRKHETFKDKPTKIICAKGCKNSAARFFILIKNIFFKK